MAKEKEKTYGDMARDDIKHHHAAMKRMEGETVENFAARIYHWQMEIYSAYAGQDIGMPFHSLPLETQAMWIMSAKEHPEWKGRRT